MNMNGPTCKNKKDIKSSKDVDEMKEGIGQGELYSPDHAIKINTKKLKEEIGQGDLYSPDHAIKVNTKQVEQNNNNNSTLDLVQKQDNHNYQEEVKGDTMVGRGVANDIKNKMSMVKERLMEKLAAASVPSDALENTRHFFESVIKDVTSAAQGLTKEALYKIKSHLADILPSQSPSLTSKMVDDAEKEVTTEESKTGEGKEIETENYEEQKGKFYPSAFSLFSTYKLMPISKL